MRVAVTLGHGWVQGKARVVGVRRTEMAACRRMRWWSSNMIVCKSVIEVGRK